MQRASAIRQLKWAAQDLYLREVGVISGSYPDWDKRVEIDVSTRDRPGGHETTRIRGWDDWKKSSFIKRKTNKKVRREFRRSTAKALLDYEVQCEEERRDWNDAYGDLDDVDGGFLDLGSDWDWDDDVRDCGSIEDLDIDDGYLDEGWASYHYDDEWSN